MTYADAAVLALQQEMQRDRRVWALGEDIGPDGGIAGQYRGLQLEFGPQRIVDTPISESTMMGAAVGAAVCGTRPVVDLRYADFGMCATDEIVNQAAKIRYMFNGQARVPLVARQAIGIRKGIAAQHSQSTEAWWVHVPGLVVVAPATPSDNHGLLKAAIRSDDPVIYLEHKELWPVRGEVDPDAEPISDWNGRDRYKRQRYHDRNLVEYAVSLHRCCKEASGIRLCCRGDRPSIPLALGSGARIGIGRPHRTAVDRSRGCPGRRIRRGNSGGSRRRIMATPARPDKTDRWAAQSRSLFTAARRSVPHIFRSD